MELLTYGGEHHEIGDGGWLMMTTAMDSPSPEPRTDSRSALPREIRAWRRLCLVKHDETFSLIFFLPETKYMELELTSVEVQRGHEIGGHALGGVPPCLVGPLMLHRPQLQLHILCFAEKKNQRESFIAFYDTEPPPSPNLSGGLIWSLFGAP